MSQSTTKPPTPAATTPPPPGSAPPARPLTPPSRPYTTRAADYEDLPPVFRRSRDDLGRILSWHTRLEDMRYRSAHTLSSDDLAALGTVVSEMAMMLGEPEVSPEGQDPGFERERAEREQHRERDRAERERDQAKK